MLEFSELKLNGLAVHKVGNLSREEGVTQSKELYDLSPDLEKVLTRYFLKPFKAEDFYQFFDEEALEQNTVYTAVANAFSDTGVLLEESVNLVNHLYRQSQHPHIKPGEVYVAHFSDCVLEGELVEMIGIFKSEIKDTFLLFDENPASVRMELKKGINTKKLDKGCLIFNTQKEEGFRVLTVDQNNYDAQYWMDDFLQLKLEANNTFHTKNFLSMVQDFAQDVVAPAEDKAEQMYVVNKSMEFFDNHETLSTEEFAQEVFNEPKTREKFQAYKEDYQESFGLDFAEDFEISEPAVKTVKKKVKSAIQLDTNIQIKMDFNDPESSHKFLEKGYDEEKEMYFYKVYFNHETG